MQFGVFQKFTSAYSFQIAREKSCDYLLIMYMKKFQYGKAEETHAYHAIKEKLRHQLLFHSPIQKIQELSLFILDLFIT